ncbi:Targeting protein for Xklp2-like 1 [Homarus americanus]|uniref:Targeting protein for Xklp2-like 1 n=1 Tax=Homarus americanus TaxID=6706 RepID=A0A8J5NAB9_HOMAM|nr:Targeting protein for Xklp2-like 1 [Homarus americanus]
MAGADGDLYEFDAPKHFFNLNENDDFEVDESYFDCPRSAEVLRDQQQPVLSALPITMETPKRLPNSSPAVNKETKKSHDKDCPTGVDKQPVSPPRAIPVDTPKGPPNSSPTIKSVDKENIGNNSGRRRKSLTRGSSLKDRIPSIGIRQSPRLAAVAKALKRAKAARTSTGSEGHNSPVKLNSSLSNRVHKSRTHNKPSVPKVHGMKGLSPEDKKDLDGISMFKKKLSENKKKSGQNRCTIPKEFHFATDTRIKNPTQNEETRAVDFTRSLRSNTPTAHNKEAPKGPTIPQPFNLTLPRTVKAENQNTFISLAELNLKFYTKTPQRFRSKRAGSTDDLNLEGKKTRGNSGVTIPHTPKLSACGRTRQMNYVAHEEMEQKAFEEAQKHSFKALPVNKKVFEAPSSGYQVEKKILTVPEPFDITDSKKVLEDEKNLVNFHAQPMPIFENGVCGVPPKKPPTPTRVKPFNLKIDQRGTIKQEQYQKHLEEQAHLDKEQRKFLARPDTVLHKNPFIPEKSKKPLTDISTFALNTEVRAVDRNEYELQHKRREDEIQAAKREANPVPKFKPMVIEHGQHPPTVPVSPNFATELRLRSRTRSAANSTMDISSATFTAD